MTKEQLIGLQETLLEFSQIEYTSLYIKDGVIDGGECDYSKINFMEYPNTKEAIEALTKNFEQLMKHFASRKVEIDELTIIPEMKVFVRAKDYDPDNKTLRKNPEYLNDKIFLTYNKCYAKTNEELIDMHDKYVQGYDKETYLVSYKEFMLGLAVKGFEVEGLSCFDDLKTNSEIGRITINFPKKQKKVRQP